MTPNQKLISSETFDLAKIYSNISNTRLHAEVLMKSKNVQGQAKDYIKRSILNRVVAIENDLKQLFVDTPDDLEIVKKEMISDEVTMQNDNVINMYYALPKGIRDEIETYIEQRYFVYTNKK